MAHLIPEEVTLGACVVVFKAHEGFGVVQVLGFDGIVVIEYTRQVVFGALFPPDVRAGVGMIIWLAGGGFQKRIHYCEFNLKRMHALTISSALLACEVPSTGTGHIHVHIKGGSAVPGPSAMLAVKGRYVAHKIAPSYGSSHGGEVLHIKGSSFTDSPLLICGAHHNTYVKARWLDGETVECVSPSQAHTGYVQFRVGLLGSGFGLGGVKFTYGRYDELVLQRGALSSHRGVIPAQASRDLTRGNIVASVDPHFYSTGFIRNRLDASTGNVPHTDIQVTFTTSPSVTYVSPQEGISGHFFVITVFGVGFQQHNPICNVAGTILRAEYLSSSIIKCDVANVNNKFGRIVVDIGVRLDLSSTLVPFPIHHEMHLREANPSTGISGGGGVFTVQGKGFMPKNHWSCKVGSIAPIAVSRVSADVVECVSPAHIIGIVDISVGFHGNGYTLDSHEYTYMPSCALQAVIPSKGSARGGSEVTLHGGGCGFKDVLCKLLGSTSVHANLWSSVMICLMTARVPGFVSMEAMHDVDVNSDSVVFEYFDVSWLTSLLPNMGMQSGGTLVTFTGISIGVNGIGCRFGGSIGFGMTVSSAIFVCESPPLGKRLATSVSVSSAASTRVEDGLELVVMFPVSLTRVLPCKGSSKGGSAVVVTAQGQLGMLGVDIAVGSTGPIASRFGGDGTLDFFSPAHYPGRTLVKMSLSPGGHSDAGLAFEYMMLGHPCVCASGCAANLEAKDSRHRRLDTMKVATLCSLGARCSDFDERVSERLGTFHRRRSPGHSTGLQLASREARQATDASMQGTEQLTPSKIVKFCPPIIAATGGVVTVYGEEFSHRTLLYHIGVGVQTNQLVSSVSIRLEITAGKSGEKIAPLVSKLRSQATMLMYEDEATAAFMQPVHGTVQGGTVLSITGNQFANSLRLSCSIGTFIPISGRWMDSHMMECISPAHQGDTVAISALNGGPVLARINMMYSYQSMASLFSNIIDTDASEGACPEHATSGQRSMATSDTRHRAMGVLETTQITRVSVCSASFKHVGFVAVALDGSRRSAHDDVPFHYFLGSIVRSIIPMQIDSGRHHLITIIGKEFNVATSSCMVEEMLLDAKMLSSTLIICELPDHVSGDVNVVIGRHLGSGNVGMVTFFRQTRVMKIVPSSGPEAGGTVILVQSSSGRQSPWQCRFGTTGPIATRTASAAAYQCTSPSHRASSAPLALSITYTGIYSFLNFGFHATLPLISMVFPKNHYVPSCKFMSRIFWPALVRGLC
jgi:hypothetical protein